jgi:hypothetical protein
MARMLSTSVLMAATLLQLGLAYPADKANGKYLTSTNLYGLERRQYDDPGDAKPEDHRWISAENVYNAVRAPCPFLNTAANHGFL